MNDEYEMKDEYDFSKGIRGPIVKPEPGKTRITIRIDDEVLDWFREQVHAAGGGNYQTDMNDALRLYIADVERESEGVPAPLELLPWLERQVRDLKAKARAHRQRA
jgi:uncharacterized protein (DUF4415 family)